MPASKCKELLSLIFFPSTSLTVFQTYSLSALTTCQQMPLHENCQDSFEDCEKWQTCHTDKFLKKPGLKLLKRHSGPSKGGGKTKDSQLSRKTKTKQPTSIHLSYQISVSFLVKLRCTERMRHTSGMNYWDLRLYPFLLLSWKLRKEQGNLFPSSRERKGSPLHFWLNVLGVEAGEKGLFRWSRTEPTVILTREKMRACLGVRTDLGGKRERIQQQGLGPGGIGTCLWLCSDSLTWAVCDNCFCFWFFIWAQRRTPALVWSWRVGDRPLPEDLSRKMRLKMTWLGNAPELRDVVSQI